MGTYCCILHISTLYHLFGCARQHILPTQIAKSHVDTTSDLSTHRHTFHSCKKYHRSCRNREQCMGCLIPVLGQQHALCPGAWQLETAGGRQRDRRELWVLGRWGTGRYWPRKERTAASRMRAEARGYYEEQLGGEGCEERVKRSNQTSVRSEGGCVVWMRGRPPPSSYTASMGQCQAAIAGTRQGQAAVALRLLWVRRRRSRKRPRGAAQRGRWQTCPRRCPSPGAAAGGTAVRRGCGRLVRGRGR